MKNKFTFIVSYISITWVIVNDLYDFIYYMDFNLIYYVKFLVSIKDFINDYYYSLTNLD